nr:MAG TPA: hypothetical protein [Caudoviricetes sp.]
MSLTFDAARAIIVSWICGYDRGGFGYASGHAAIHPQIQTKPVTLRRHGLLSYQQEVHRHVS